VTQEYGRYDMHPPLGLIIAGAVLIVTGLMGVLSGIRSVGFGGAAWLAGLMASDAIQTWGGSAVGGGFLDMANGALKTIAGAGVIGLLRWAWLLALATTGFSVAMALVGLFSGKWWAAFGLIVPGLLLLYLVTPNVRRVFGQTAANDQVAGREV
jgi:hypothetical protein